MAFPEDQLYSEEQVVLDLRPHWWFFSRQILALVAALAVGVLTLVLSGGNAIASIAAAVLLIATLGWFTVRYIVWNTTNFVVTSDRLITRSGVLNRSGIEIPLERVNTVFFQQTIFERLIGSGDLAIESAGEQGSQRFTDIRKPLNVQNEIYRQMEGNENRKFDRVGRNLESSQGGGGSNRSIPDQIQELDDLRKQGILTNSEFDQKKKELLDRM